MLHVLYVCVPRYCCVNSSYTVTVAPYCQCACYVCTSCVVMFPTTVSTVSQGAVYIL